MNSLYSMSNMKRFNGPETFSQLMTKDLLYKSGTFDGTKYPSLGSVEAGLNAIEGACVTPNGTDNKIEFTHADVANIDNVKAYVLDGTWQEVTSDTDLYSISGTTLTLFYDTSWYANQVAYFKAYDSSDNLLFHFPFCEAKGDKVYDVVTGGSATIVGTVSDATTWGNTQDEYFYNLETGFDLWQNDTDSEYIYIPLQVDGTSILTDGDTLTGYTWVSKHVQTGDKILPFEGRFQFDNNAGLISADNGHSYLYSLNDSAMAKLDYNELFGKEAYNNLVVNGRFADGTYGWIHYASYSVETLENNWLISTRDTNRPYPGREDSLGISSGSKVYVSFSGLANRNGNLKFAFASGVIGLTDVGSTIFSFTTTETVFSKIITLTSIGNSFYLDGSSFLSAGDYIAIKNNIQIYNLTAIYGAGNEPSTIDEEELKELAGYNIFCRDTTGGKDRLLIYSTGQTGSKLAKIETYTGQ